ncbi:hypothetical protein J2Y69_001386 [Microbacterium resistens]|uniref:DUF2116 family Zn-ribbon domain-containing protein n=1 Tax=Microbacterium resistens TaxID=156977 RepID=A0ABU1SAZ5_9MICO|nr:hypothetical protein [Microbacterium resistens]MDR6866787.1 hypothetical protein [Microbacterium resistens]
MAFLIQCAECARPATLAKPGRFCSDACRARNFRYRLAAQRARLTDAADAALASGDVAALEDVARRATELLKR